MMLVVNEDGITVAEGDLFAAITDGELNEAVNGMEKILWQFKKRNE